MSAVPGGVEEHELNAFVDGRLTGERAAVVDAYLKARPEELARLGQYAEQQRDLRAAFTMPTAEPIPSRLRVARLVAVRRGRRHWQFAALAAAIGLLIVGAAGGWGARDWGIRLPQSRTAKAAAAEREITADAIAAHQVYSVEVKHPVEVGATQEAHLVQWLSNRLGRRLVVPDLTVAGYQLMGGRLLPSEVGPAAQFMYQNGNTRLTLYERADSGGETAFRYTEENGIGAFYWSDRDFGYALTAKAERAELMKIAEIVFRQLSSESAKPPAPPPAVPGKRS
jgi:anti-sigma factor RsiW